MLKIRVIPVLFLMNGLIVRSEEFRDFKVIGNPINELARYSEWQADELVYVDITREGEHDLRRSDHKIKMETQADVVGVLRQLSRAAFMPLTFGGRLTTLEQVDQILHNGADKVIINSGVYRRPQLIAEVADKYGSQAMMVGIDVKREGDRHALYIDQGRTRLPDDPVEYARKVESLGAGEILVNAIDRDGTARGYDIEIIRKIAEVVGIPVIACGGVGRFEDFRAGIAEGRASAVAAGNIFHFTEHSYKRAKKVLKDKGIDVRYPYPR
jgi:cyclase